MGKAPGYLGWQLRRSDWVVDSRQTSPMNRALFCAVLNESECVWGSPQDALTPMSCILTEGGLSGCHSRPKTGHKPRRWRRDAGAVLVPARAAEKESSLKSLPH